MRYGSLPVDLGLIDLSPVEMMFWMYCPIHTPKWGLVLPENLDQYWPILRAVKAYEGERWRESYVYITAKVLYVSGNCGGTRPGWHSDGFGTEDRNYIWYDSAPTEFIKDDFALPDDCIDAMLYMEQQARGAHIYTYPNKHLLALTPQVIHRPAEMFETGVRSFVKVSVSKNRYNLVGNSRNHGLSEHWHMVPRQLDRNHPHPSHPQIPRSPRRSQALYP